MFPTVSPGELWELFKATKELIDKIKDAPKRVEEVGKRLSGLENHLIRLKEEFVDDKGKIDSNLKQSARTILQRILSDLYTSIKGVKEILKIWYDNTAFALGKNPDKLEALEKEIAYNRNELSEWLTMTIAEKVTQIVVQPKASVNPKKQVSVLILDKDNIGRSKILEAYLNLLQNWTVKSKGNWRIKTIHSAGLNLSFKSECSEQIKRLGHVHTGNEPPMQVAMSALFDNNLFEGDHKTQLRQKIEQSRSRGITNTLFRDHDYIIVFTKLMVDNLVVLRQRLIRQYDTGAAPPEMGKVVLLGQFAGKETKFIGHPDPQGSYERDHQEWIRVTGLIKVSIKNFLKFQLDWKQPARARKADSPVTS